jgi:serine/threonine protein kinase
MIRIQDSRKKVISIGHYKIIEVLQSDETKDLFHVQDLKTPSKEYMLRILKSNQNPKQIDNEIEVLNTLNPYTETLNFRKVEIFSDKLLFIFDYAKGKNLIDLYEEDATFFSDEKIKHFVSDALRVLEIYRENHIVHRNINPENIIYDGNNYFIVGLSKAVINKEKDSIEDKNGIVSVLYYLITGKKLEIEINVQEKEYSELTSTIYHIIKSNSFNIDSLRKEMYKI